jgi:predicted alpha/beta-fold hydrolase
MVAGYFQHATWHGALCIAALAAQGLGEIGLSVLCAPFRGGDDESEHRNLVTYVKTATNDSLVAACPSIHSFRPLWWARGGLAQTLVPSLVLTLALTTTTGDRYRYRYRRELFTLPHDGVQVALDWKGGVAEQAPIVLCLHGLGGDRDSPYLQVFTDACARRGYRAVVYNRRGHGHVSLLPPPGAAAGRSPAVFPRHCNMEDMVAVVEHLCARFPHAPKYLIGFSCGANLAVNYLAHVGPECPFLATASVSNGYDILAATDRMGPVARGVSAQFLKDLLAHGDRLSEAKALAVHARAVGVDVDAALRSRSLADLDGHLTAPAYGFANVADYYAAESCYSKMAKVASPLLCIASQSDPLLDAELTRMPVQAAASNPHVLTVVTRDGGHVGWIDGAHAAPWYARLFFEFCRGKAGSRLPPAPMSRIFGLTPASGRTRVTNGR